MGFGLVCRWYGWCNSLIRNLGLVIVLCWLYRIGNGNWWCWIGEFWCCCLVSLYCLFMILWWCSWCNIVDWNNGLFGISNWIVCYLGCKIVYSGLWMYLLGFFLVNVGWNFFRCWVIGCLLNFCWCCCFFWRIYCWIFFVFCIVWNSFC